MLVCRAICILAISMCVPALSGCQKSPDDKRYYDVVIDVDNDSGQSIEKLRIDFAGQQLPLGRYNETARLLGTGYGDEMPIPEFVNASWQSQGRTLAFAIPIRSKLRDAAEFRGVITFFLDDDSLVVAAWDCHSKDSTPSVLFLTDEGKERPVNELEAVPAGRDAILTFESVGAGCAAVKR